MNFYVLVMQTFVVLDKQNINSVQVCRCYCRMFSELTFFLKQYMFIQLASNHSKLTHALIQSLRPDIPINCRSKFQKNHISHHCRYIVILTTICVCSQKHEITIKLHKKIKLLEIYGIQH